MLITISYLLLYFITERAKRLRRMKLLAALSCRLKTASVVLRHAGRLPVLSPLYRVSPFCSRSNDPLKYDTLLDAGLKKVLSVCPKLQVGMNDWTLFVNKELPISTPISNEQHFVLVEAKRFSNAVEKEILNADSTSVIRFYMQLSKLMAPLAWKSGTPYGLIMEAGDAEFLTAAEAFIDGTLRLEEGLHIEQIMSVTLSGEPKQLLDISLTPLSPVIHRLASDDQVFDWEFVPMSHTTEHHSGTHERSFSSSVDVDIGAFALDDENYSSNTVMTARDTECVEKTSVDLSLPNDEEKNCSVLETDSPVPCLGQKFHTEISVIHSESPSTQRNVSSDNVLASSIYFINSEMDMQNRLTSDSDFSQSSCMGASESSEARFQVGSSAQSQQSITEQESTNLKNESFNEAHETKNSHTFVHDKTPDQIENDLFFDSINQFDDGETYADFAAGPNEKSVDKLTLINELVLSETADQYNDKSDGRGLISLNQDLLTTKNPDQEVNISKSSNIEPPLAPPRRKARHKSEDTVQSTPSSLPVDGDTVCGSIPDISDSDSGFRDLSTLSDFSGGQYEAGEQLAEKPEFTYVNNEDGDDKVNETPILKLSESFKKANIVSQDVQQGNHDANSRGLSDGNSYRQSKPPNVLVYTGEDESGAERYKNVLKTISHCLNRDCYSIYKLSADQVQTTPWYENTAALLISCDHIRPDIENKFLKFFENGGRVVSFCSPIDKKILIVHPLKRAKNLKKRKVAKILYDSCELTLMSQGRWYQPADVLLPSLKVESIMYDKERRTVVVKVENEACDGCALLCQVRLDLEPSDESMDEESFSSLKQSNKDRLETLRALLSTSMSLNCDQSQLPELAPAFLYTSTDVLAASLLSNLGSTARECFLTAKSVSLRFLSTLPDDPVQEDLLPVVFGRVAEEQKNFDRHEYFSNLKTEVLGNTVMYCDVVPTTMNLFDRLMFIVPEEVGLIAVARQQTSGKGRGGNTWISPIGCAMFSLHLRVPLKSHLGQKPSYVQHLISLAVVEAVCNIPGYEDINLRLKWPNDIYYGRHVKIGGVIVNSTILGALHAVVGCGVNVSNSTPTCCINDVIRQHNVEHGTVLNEFTCESLIAKAVTEFEKLVEKVQTDGVEAILPLYYKRWLHSGAEVRLADQDNKVVIIEGLDEFGYLLVKSPDGSYASVQPDGNTFDMLKNLITLKER